MRRLLRQIDLGHGLLGLLAGATLIVLHHYMLIDQGTNCGTAIVLLLKGERLMSVVRRMAVLDCPGRVNEIRIDRHFVLIVELGQILILRLNYNGWNHLVVFVSKFVGCHALRTVAPRVVLLCDQKHLGSLTRRVGI